MKAKVRAATESIAKEMLAGFMENVKIKLRKCCWLFYTEMAY
jgi:hypothetical protein